MNFNKTGIAPVIAIALLLVATVAGVTTFNNWFKTYNSELEVKSQIKSNDIHELNMQMIQSYNNNLRIHISNLYKENILIDNIKINSNNCNLIGSDVLVSNSITFIDVDCIETSGSQVDIILKANNKLVTKKLYLK